MLREQAIFFEVMEDLYISGHLEPQIFAYHDFIMNFDFSSATDLEIHARAVECLKRYEEMIKGKSSKSRIFYDMRWDILEKLDLENAKWEYRDRAVASGN